MTMTEDNNRSLRQHTSRSVAARYSLLVFGQYCNLPENSKKIHEHFYLQELCSINSKCSVSTITWSHLTVCIPDCDKTMNLQLILTEVIPCWHFFYDFPLRLSLLNPVVFLWCVQQDGGQSLCPLFQHLPFLAGYLLSASVGTLSGS